MSRDVTCPECKHTFTVTAVGYQPKRWCSRCGKVIGRHHKFTFERKGKATVLVHRHCDNPEAYLPR